MKNILLASILISSSMALARPVNPEQPDFNHSACLSDYSMNSASRQNAADKSEALALLEKIKQDDSFQKEKLSKLDHSQKLYLFRLSQDSNNLDQELDLSGSCENMNSILSYIIQTLK